jgi:hypothetical protein
MQQVGFLEADRIYSEVRVVNGVVTQIGGTPGGPAGSHNIDIMVARPGTTISVGDNISGGVAETIGDLKYGGGVIDPKYAVHGSPTVTITGRTTAGPVPVVPEPIVAPTAELLGGGLGIIGGGLMLWGNDRSDPAAVQALTYASGGAQVAGGGTQLLGGLLAWGGVEGGAGLAAAGATLSGVGIVLGFPLMMYGMAKGGAAAFERTVVEGSRQDAERWYQQNPDAPPGMYEQMNSVDNPANQYLGDPIDIFAPH